MRFLLLLPAALSLFWLSELGVGSQPRLPDISSDFWSGTTVGWLMKRYPGGFPSRITEFNYP
jgi:hypothetical protein